jgi:hypothetical protein
MLAHTELSQAVDQVERCMSSVGLRGGWSISVSAARAAAKSTQAARAHDRIHVGEDLEHLLSDDRVADRRGADAVERDQPAFAAAELIRGEDLDVGLWRERR